MDCLFCKIISGEIPTTLLYEDDLIIAFNDIKAVAPQHILIVPKKHIATLNEVDSSETELIGKMFFVGTTLAKKIHVAADGYRFVMNCNAAAGQTVFHLHLHLIGGRKLSWPPG